LGETGSAQIIGKTDVDVPAGDVGSFPMTLRAPRAFSVGMRSIRIDVSNDDNTIHTARTARFYSPEKP
jgi:hypothetical protein